MASEVVVIVVVVMMMSADIVGVAIPNRNAHVPLATGTMPWFVFVCQSK